MTPARKIKLHSRCCLKWGPYLSSWDGGSFLLLETPGSYSTLHSAEKAGRLCMPSPCSKGNLSKPRELLHYLQSSFCITLYLQGTFNKQDTPSRYSQQLWSSCTGTARRSSPCPSTFFLKAHGSPAPACAVMSVPPWIWEVRSLGEVGLLQFRALHSQSITPGQKTKSKDLLNLLLPPKSRPGGPLAWSTATSLPVGTLTLIYPSLLSTDSQRDLFKI